MEANLFNGEYFEAPRRPPGAGAAIDPGIIATRTAATSTIPCFSSAPPAS